MLLKFVVVCVVVGVVTPALKSEWPCPDSADIVPCSCTDDSYLNLKLDCSGVQDTDQLVRAFSTPFPFPTFLEFMIDHSANPNKSNLTVLPPNLFKGLTFERIIIKGTQLFDIEENVFTESYKTLKYLNLADNMLQKFPFETLDGYTILSNLVLDNNHLPALPRIVSDSLEILSVSGNTDMELLPDVFTKTSVLSRINMARIGLTNIRPNLFFNLNEPVIINLADNKISYLDEFAINPPSNTLLQVILDGNTISNIRHDSIQGLAPNAYLSMSKNRITEITETVWRHIFDQIPNGSLDLSVNPLLCGCDVYWIFHCTEHTYRKTFTPTTTCYDNTQVLYLDCNFFEAECNVLQ
ncbi:oplophorus-luciferin 2-monooxygenase non-catalytic subunit-like [Homarus americanus]|uniref:Oplophorus-luciferin 2-monooxygenase non-catalytic subunit-like 10 n=1 Tax=Homarus americanus TaxID=6706 RepID=A0A8J5JTW3_HOMAM|nr:oplophorus-luciferin 2-monooxygenase non-catalytic subunit-like [Homarus americanus]KAG7164082.1 Oplophorus-luciferin 2-monooxygenase non-catalytic subunit-like 10 [Homarus americanus]